MSVKHLYIYTSDNCSQVCYCFRSPHEMYTTWLLAIMRVVQVLWFSLATSPPLVLTLSSMHSCMLLWKFLIEPSWVMTAYAWILIWNGFLPNLYNIMVGQQLPGDNLFESIVCGNLGRDIGLPFQVSHGGLLQCLEGKATWLLLSCNNMAVWAKEQATNLPILDDLGSSNRTFMAVVFSTASAGSLWYFSMFPE